MALCNRGAYNIPLYRNIRKPCHVYWKFIFLIEGNSITSEIISNSIKVLSSFAFRNPPKARINSETSDRGRSHTGTLDWENWKKKGRQKLFQKANLLCSLYIHMYTYFISIQLVHIIMESVLLVCWVGMRTVNVLSGVGKWVISANECIPCTKKITWNTGNVNNKGFCSYIRKYERHTHLYQIAHIRVFKKKIIPGSY